jgi:arylsulfatase A
MSVRQTLILVSCLCLLVLVKPVAASDPSMNVVLILADDMGIDSVSAFNDKLGLETAAIDHLAREGMSFTDAHSTSGVCSPTRYALLTGRYNWRSRLKRGIVGQWVPPLIEPQRLTIAQMFQNHGYETACIGKWHLGWHWPRRGGGTTTKLAEIDFTAPVTGGPNDAGFDYYFGDDVPNWPPYIWRENEKLLGTISTTMKAGAMVGVSAGPAVEDWQFDAVLPEYARRCADFIRQRADSVRPYFLFFPMPSPHTPIAPNQTFKGVSGISDYADFLLETDWAVGELLKAIDESGQSENTVVFFTADNGTSPKADFPQLAEAGVHLNEHWRGWKADAYEGGHRVPFIVRWPGVTKPGSRSAETIVLTDVMATCADLLEFALPATAAEDSVSLLPRLSADRSEPPLHDAVVHHSSEGHFAVRKGPWKLMFCRGSGGWSPPREAEARSQGLPPLQLYHLGRDPKETTNVQSEHPEIVQEMTADLRRMVEQGRTTPGPRQPNHEGGLWWPGLPWDKPAN